jgi:hypothetical protein
MILIELVGKLNEQKSAFFTLIDRLNVYNVSSKSQTVTLKLVDKVGEEIKAIEDLHKNTSLEYDLFFSFFIKVVDI